MIQIASASEVKKFFPFFFFNDIPGEFYKTVNEVFYFTLLEMDKLIFVGQCINKQNNKKPSTRS